MDVTLSVTVIVTVTVTETVTVGDEPSVTHGITENVIVGETTVDADSVSVTVSPLGGTASEIGADGDGGIGVWNLASAGQAFARSQS
jgi:hypothetical protein